MTDATAVCSRCGKAKPLTSSEFVNGKALPLCEGCHRDKKLATMVRLLTSNRTGEAEGAMRKFVSTLQSAGPTIINDIADRIELSEREMQEVYSAGIKEGIRQVEHKMHQAPYGPPQLQMPSGRDMAIFCYQNIDRLTRDKDKDFIISVMRQTRTRPPTPKQQPWLEDLYVQLAGRI
jgi:hypothetical protein